VNSLSSADSRGGGLEGHQVDRRRRYLRSLTDKPSRGGRSSDAIENFREETQVRLACSEFAIYANFTKGLVRSPRHQAVAGENVMDSILVIDDDIEMCGMLVEYLQSEELQVETVHDGEQGLK
jgi:hypothetical protein